MNALKHKQGFWTSGVNCGRMKCVKQKNRHTTFSGNQQWYIITVTSVTTSKYFPHYWPFRWEIHRWRVDSSHEGPTTQIADDIFVLSLILPYNTPGPVIFHSYIESNKMAVSKFCPWHHSCAAVTYMTIWCDLMANDWITVNEFPIEFELRPKGN